MGGQLLLLLLLLCSTRTRRRGSSTAANHSHRGRRTAEAAPRGRGRPPSRVSASRAGGGLGLNGARLYMGACPQPRRAAHRCNRQGSASPATRLAAPSVQSRPDSTDFQPRSGAVTRAIFAEEKRETGTGGSTESTRSSARDY
jgi:hypothetical protein